MKVTELLTHSKRSNFQWCRRYFYYRHEERITSRRQKQGRRRGTVFGQALFDVQQECWKDVSNFDARTVIEESVNDQYDEILENDIYYTADDASTMEVERVKMMEVCAAYVDHYGVDRRREIEFNFSLRNPRTKRYSRTFRQAGKIDGVVVLEPGRVRIVEDKLVSQLQKVMIERLPLDLQASEYVDAFMQQGWEAEVAYRHTRWPGVNPLAPKQFKTKDDYPGETLEEFAERLRDDIQDRLDWYFDQQILNFPVSHMEEYRAERWGIGQQILDARRKPKSQWAEAYPKNPTRCWEYGGCEFIPLCTRLEGARDLYVQVEDSPELEAGREEAASAN
jgi:hypothetical protein